MDNVYALKMYVFGRDVWRFSVQFAKLNIHHDFQKPMIRQNKHLPILIKREFFESSLFLVDFIVISMYFSVSNFPIFLIKSPSNFTNPSFAKLNPRQQSHVSHSPNLNKDAKINPRKVNCISF